MQFIYLYLIAIPIFVVLDLLWIGVIAKHLYRSYIGHLMGPVNWAAAIAFYLIFLVGLTFFAINPAFVGQSFWFATILGGMFGFFTYATYDLTNMATLKNWPLGITIIDIIWGTILGAAVSSLTYLVATWIL